MADYWKSQPRKFCEFCKCWITDNKPSVEFHERGKRHKENVQKKIDEVRKRSGEKAKEQEEINAGLAHIEKAALEALKKDIAQDPGLAAQYGVKIKTAGPQTREESEKESTKSAPTNIPPKVKEWFEAKSPEGYSYYWNISTNESVWEPPAEYVSLAEQEGVREEESGEESQESLEDRDHDYEEEQKPPPKKILRVDPVGARGAAYGAWTTIREESPPEQEEPEPEPEKPEPGASKALPEVVDIPLPQDIPLPGEIPLPAQPKAAMQPLEIPLPASIEEPQEKESSSQLEVSVKKDRFKEKTVASLGFSAGVSVGFKKRKVASSARNSRQRDGDD